MNSHWEILTEAIQTIFRKYNDNQAYEKMKNISRGEQITEMIIKEIINQSNLPGSEKKKLLDLTPQKYLGLAKKLSTLK